MKEDEIDAGESRGVERFVTHVDLNQAGTLLVSLAHAERESAPHIKCDFELFFPSLTLACCQKWKCGEFSLNVNEKKICERRNYENYDHMKSID